MEKYEKAKMEVVEFEAEDVISTSGECYSDANCPYDDWTPPKL